MSFFEALKLAFASILSHKLRSFLTLLGVIFGVATVIVVVSLVEGFNAYVDEKIANIGTNAFSVQRFSIQDYSSVEALNAARRRNKDVSSDDLQALKSLGGFIKDAGGKSTPVFQKRSNHSAQTRFTPSNSILVSTSILRWRKEPASH